MVDWSPDPRSTPGRLGLGLLIAATPVFAGHAGTAKSAYARYHEAGARLEARTDAVRELYDPSTTLLVTSVEYWSWGLRHVAHALPEFPTLQLYQDPHFALLSAEQPYLLSHRADLRAAGPDPIGLRTLLPDAAGRAIRIVYMVPHDSRRFIDPACIPIISAIDVGNSEQLAVIAPRPGGLKVYVQGQALRCHKW